MLQKFNNTWWKANWSIGCNFTGRFASFQNWYDSSNSTNLWKISIQEWSIEDFKKFSKKNWTQIFQASWWNTVRASSVFAFGKYKFFQGEFGASFLVCRRRVNLFLELSDEFTIFGSHIDSCIVVVGEDVGFYLSISYFVTILRHGFVKRVYSWGCK